MSFLTESDLRCLTGQLEALEENQYREQQRLHLVPPHYILINPESQAEYDQLLKKDRRRQILEKGFLAFPEGQMVTDDDNLLAVVNEQVFQKPWVKLELEFQINRLFLYLNQLEDLTADRLNTLRKLLVNACFRKELGAHQVIYDCQRGVIQRILGLNSQGPEVSLTILKAPEKIVPVVRVSEIVGSTEDSGIAGIAGIAGDSKKIAKPILKLKTQTVNPTDPLPKSQIIKPPKLLKMPIVKPKIKKAV